MKRFKNNAKYSKKCYQASINPRVAYLLSIENFKNNPGIGWEQVPNHSIWIYEFDDLDLIKRDDLIVKTIDKCIINSDTERAHFNLHVNVSDVDGFTGINFGVDFLKQLNARNCSVSIEIHPTYNL